MLLVAYTETTWTMRNSYGTDWGDEGYISYVRDSPYLTSCQFFDRAFYITVTDRRGTPSPSVTSSHVISPAVT